MRQFINRYKQVIAKQSLDKNSMIHTLFNFVFENEAIYKGLFQKFEAHMNFIRGKFTKAAAGENAVA